MSGISKENFRPLNIILIIIVLANPIIFSIAHSITSEISLIGIISYIIGDHSVEINDVQVELPIRYYIDFTSDSTDYYHVSLGDYKGNGGFFYIYKESGEELALFQERATEFKTGYDRFPRAGINSVYKYNDETIYLTEEICPDFNSFTYVYTAIIPERYISFFMVYSETDKQSFLKLVRTLFCDDKNGELKHVTDLTGLEGNQ